MSEPQLERGLERKRSDGIVDYKRIASRTLNYWYLVVLSLVLTLFGAYLTNRYAVGIYPVTASVLIREKEALGGAEILYNNPLVNPVRNYLNEPYIIRSYPLVGSVISNLNFDVAFFREGNIKTTEVYDLPVKVRLLKQNGSYGTSLIFVALDENRYSIQAADEKGNDKARTFYFNDSIEFKGHHFIVLKDLRQSIRRIKNDPLKLTFLNPLTITTAYIKGLVIDWAEEGAGVLNLTVTGSNPDKEVDFMNGLLDSYQKYDLNKKNLEAERTIRFIKQQLHEISDSLDIFESKLLKLKIQNSSYGASVTLSFTSAFSSTSGSSSGSMGMSSDQETDMSDDVATRLYSQLATLQGQKVELLIRSNYFSYLDKYITGNKTLDLVVLPASLGIEDEVLSGIVNRIIDIQLELKLFFSKGISDNPAVQDGLKKLEELKHNTLEAIDQLRLVDKYRSDQINEQIAEVEKQIDQLPSELKEFISIQRNYSLLEALYVFLVQKMAEASISKASAVSDISVVNPPMQGGLISPKISQNYIFGGLLGLLFPLALFALLELLNQKVQSKEDIDKITNIPFIGGVWHHPYKDNLAVNRWPKSAVAESFRAIRSNLNYFTGNELKKVFMVTSSVSGEGKSFTTINLATVFAMSGRKTLIVGADMRKPRIYDDFNLGNLRGLSGYLSQLNTFSDVVQRTSIDNLDLVSGGPVPPNPSELLLTDHFGALIKEALTVYDYIIIDTPPLAIVTDAFVLSKYADHTIFVVRQNFTQRALLRDIHDLFASGKLKNISIVLNDISKTGFGYGYGYGYGYSYGKKYKGDGYYS
jgi:capsular exopolysaccharide synthesis family protein